MGLTTTKPLDDPFAVFGTTRKTVVPTTPLATTKPPVTSGALTNPFEVFKAPEKAASLTKEDVLATPEDMASIRQMMVYSKGTDYKTLSDEQVYDDFQSHMRWFNTNEVYTLKEATDVYAADDETKAAYARAYEVDAKIGTLFTNGGSVGDKFGAVGDYTKAIITSPTTWIGFGIGKGVSMLSGRAAAAAIKKGATSVAKVAAKKGASKASQREVVEVVTRLATKTNLKISTLAALGVEAPAATLQDYFYQDVMMEVGAQEEFNYMQSAMSTMLGGAMAGTSYLIGGPLRGVSGLADTGAKVEAGKVARAAGAKKRVADDIKVSIKAVSADWIKLVKEGRGLDENQELRDSVVSWFTDYTTEGGFISILQRNGAKLDVESAGGFAKSLVQFTKGLDGELRAGVDEAFRPLGITLGQVTDIFASTVNEAGYQNQLLSSASKFWENFKGITIANRSASKGLLEAAEEAEKAEKLLPDKEVLGYLQGLFKGMIVSHPATTIINVKGWGFSMLGRTAAEALQMSVLYGAGGIKTLMGSSTAKVTLGQADALMKNLAYMTKMAVDPFITLEAFYKLLDDAPKKIKGEVSRQFFQGVEKKGAAAYGLDNTKGLWKNTDRMLEYAQRYSFVNAQDVLTKSFSGIKELDKQSRLVHGIGLDDLITTGRSHEITEEMWQKAVDALQEDTFSVDFSRSTGFFGTAAALGQKVSATPGFGFLYPFGQFVNSIAAYATRYSLIGLVPIGAKIWKEGAKGMSIDAGTKTMQALVGTTALTLIAFREKGKQAEGLQWNEERDPTGSVYKVDTMFPLGLYNLAGRIMLDIVEGDGGNKDLWTSLAQQLSFPAALSDAGSPQIIGDMVKYMTDARTPPEDSNAVKEALKAAWGSIVPGIANIAAGYTRPIDPYNDIMGLISEDQGFTSTTTIDRKQSEGIDLIVQNLTRYTNTLFNALLGEEGEDGRKLYGEPKFSATQKEPVRSGNEAAAIFGTSYTQRRTPIDTLLAMVDKAPFKADSFTSGIPAYDAWMNETINPNLERRAIALLDNPNFKRMSKAMQIAEVDKQLSAAKVEVLFALENGTVGGPRERLLREQAKLSTKSRPAMLDAMKNLGINVSVSKLTLAQINAILREMEMTADFNKETFNR